MRSGGGILLMLRIYVSVQVGDFGQSFLLHWVAEDLHGNWI